MSRCLTILLLLFSIPVIFACALVEEGKRPNVVPLSAEELSPYLTKAIAIDQTVPRASTLTITYPYEGTLFPNDITAPTFIWNDTNTRVHSWIVHVAFTDGKSPLTSIVTEPSWTPDKSTWATIKTCSLQGDARLFVFGLGANSIPLAGASDTLSFSTSEDRVDATVFFRQVPLPFSTKNFRQMRWCLGDVTSSAKPRVVMDNLPICASCHVFSRNGKTMSMEMNLNGDSGAQFIAKVEKEIVVKPENFMSWNDFPRGGVLPKSRGLFGKMSPNGRYLISSINEISLALITNELAFSQVFFPTYGILASYSVAEKTIKPLPGADNFDFVHANPNWHPEEKFIVFSRAKTKNELHDDIANVVPMKKEAGIEELNKQYNIQFDIYSIPFNNGEGGVAKPLPGASNNGYSNYFPRYSPDGKWIVFTRSRTGIMLQPDSQLFIVPSEGGVARKMTCNRALFNSWHSWSPNGKWLLFSSKVNTPYTEIFLTHIDENGNDTPPVLLSHLSSSTHAANVPEFINVKFNNLHQIRLQKN